MGVMRRNMVVAKSLFFLVVAGLLLPAAICVVVALAALLHVMDPAGAQALRYIALAGGVLWVVDLVAIVLVQALAALFPPDEDDK